MQILGGGKAMWIADGWQDYELLDCGGGEKLERWGRQVLVRPDPQAIWDTPRRNPGWQRPDGRYFRSSGRKNNGCHLNLLWLPPRLLYKSHPMHSAELPLLYFH